VCFSPVVEVLFSRRGIPLNSVELR